MIFANQRRVNMEEFAVPRSVDTRATARIITLETTAIVSIIYTYT